MTHRYFIRLALLSSLALLACGRNDARAESSPAKPVAAAHIAIAVTADGFTPSSTHVKVGQPVTLVVTRKVAQTCATDIVIKDYGVNRPLPQDQAVEITFTPTKPGPIHYTCAMGMVTGDLVAE
jgi:plastocyanin domain-containing protein